MYDTSNMANVSKANVFVKKLVISLKFEFNPCACILIKKSKMALRPSSAVLLGVNRVVLQILKSVNDHVKIIFRKQR